MTKKDQKYCIACLEESRIKEWWIDCFDLEHQKRYEVKTIAIGHFNNLIDEKIKELLSVRDLLLDLHKTTKK